MKELEKTYELFSPTDVNFFGEQTDFNIIGHVRCTLTRTSGEELTDDGVERSRQRYMGYVPHAKAPIGGFLRGMALSDNGRKYEIRSAERLPHCWMLVLDRIIFEGEA